MRLVECCATRHHRDARGEVAGQLNQRGTKHGFSHSTLKEESMKRISVVVSMALLATVILSACGGGGGGGAAGAAQAWFQAFSQLDVAKIKDLTCEAQKATIEDALSVLGGGGAADTEAIRQLFKIDVSGL